MLRAVRFAAAFNFTIEPDTLRAIQEMAAEITTVSAERIGMEIRRMLLDPNRADGAPSAARNKVAAADYSRSRQRLSSRRICGNDAHSCQLYASQRFPSPSPRCLKFLDGSSIRNWPPATLHQQRNRPRQLAASKFERSAERTDNFPGPSCNDC